MNLLDKLYARFGFNALVSGQHQKAETYFRKIRTRTGEAMGSNHNLGMACLAAGNLAGAKDCFLREIELFGPSYSRARVLADVYFALADQPKSLETYMLAKRLAQGEKDLPQVEERLKLCRSPGRFKAASGASSLCREGLAAEQAGDVQEALSRYVRAADLDPANVQALNNAGACLERLGKLRTAQKYFKQAFALSGLKAIEKNIKKIEKAISKQKDNA
ncbi:MAG: tetratricopeptide repeat protein [Desulfobacterales bacterium]|nr:tetratricopeptide repeat protein [Desulfobacterales bacterium]